MAARGLRPRGGRLRMQCTAYLNHVQRNDSEHESHMVSGNARSPRFKQLWKPRIGEYVRTARCDIRTHLLESGSDIRTSAKPSAASSLHSVNQTLPFRRPDVCGGTKAPALQIVFPLQSSYSLVTALSSNPSASWIPFRTSGALGAGSQSVRDAVPCPSATRMHSRRCSRWIHL